MLEMMTEPVGQQAATAGFRTQEQESTGADFLPVLLGLVTSQPVAAADNSASDPAGLPCESYESEPFQAGPDSRSAAQPERSEAPQLAVSAAGEPSTEPRNRPAALENAAEIPDVGEFLPTGSQPAEAQPGPEVSRSSASGGAAPPAGRIGRSEADLRASVLRPPPAALKAGRIGRLEADLRAREEAANVPEPRPAGAPAPNAETGTSSPGPTGAAFDLPEAAAPDGVRATGSAEHGAKAQSDVVDFRAAQSDTAPAAEPVDAVTVFARAVESRLTGDATAPREPAVGRADQGAELTRAVAGRIIREVSLLRSGENATLTIRLTPPELGVLRVSVRSESGVLTTELQSPNETVRGLLESSLPALREQLNGAGIEISRFTVSAGLDFGQLADRRPQTWQQAGAAGNPTYFGTNDRSEDRGAIASAVDGTTAGYDWLA